MVKPLPLLIGLRYIRSKRRHQFMALTSAISLLGMILGVFALIVVMSVMNGFAAELRGRILSVIPHGYIDGPNQQLSNWQQWSTIITQDPSVIAVAPYMMGQVMLSRPGVMRGAQLTAIDPVQEVLVSGVVQQMVAGSLVDLEPGMYGIVLGDLLARQMGLRPNDTVTVILPKVTITPLGLFPRLKTFTVIGLLSTGTELDMQTAFIHLSDGQKLFQMGDHVQGLRVALDDLFKASVVLPKLADSITGAQVRVWSETQGNLFRAIAMEKTVVALLLLIIIAVAAFNIIATLTVMVANKRGDIAILRTMGASSRSITAIFMVQGVVMGVLGITIGVALGVPVSLYMGHLVRWFENQWGIQLFDPQIYFINTLPSLLQWSDVYWVVLCALALSVLATWYPARRAAKVNPARILRY